VFKKYLTVFSALFILSTKTAHSSVANEYLRIVSVPSTINSGLTYGKEETIKGILGPPTVEKPKECLDPSRITDERLRRLIIDKNVGPFKVTGLKPAVETIKRIFTKVKQEKPDLYKYLGTAGMLCIRHIRGNPNKFSNHAWGTAIDITIKSRPTDNPYSDNNNLYPYNEKGTYEGLLEIYPYFHEEKFFWGAGFQQKPDAMHFEASDELIQEWKAKGFIP